MCVGLNTAISTTITKGNPSANVIPFLKKVKNFLHEVQVIDLALCGSYGDIVVNRQPRKTLYTPTNSKIKFPEDMEMIIAHSMTPLPKKMIKGKRQNLRACEIHIGIEIIKAELGAVATIESLGQLQ